MIKNKGIWIVIGSILLIGILITFTISSFVKSNESIQGLEGNAYQETNGEDNQEDGTPKLLSPDPAEPRDFGVEEKETSAAPKQKGFGEAGTRLKTAEDPIQGKAPKKALDNPETASPTEPVISPLSPDTKNRLSDEELTEGAAYYQKHLKDLDTQIEKMRKESLSANTYSMKALADKEFELWDREQSVIYNVILEKLSDKDKTALKADQNAWAKRRDTKAEEAARKYSGGSLEELEYTASMAESSRTRAYDLVDEYKEVLSVKDEK